MFKSLVWLDPGKISSQSGFDPGIFRSRGGRLTTRPTRRSRTHWAEVQLSHSRTCMGVSEYASILIASRQDGAVGSRHNRCLSMQTEVRTGNVVDRLVGLVVRRPPRERKIPGSNPACAGIFSGSSHTNDLKIGTPVATLPGAWRYRVSTGTGRPGVSILWLGEVERLMCNFYLSVAARTIVWADPSLRYTSLLLGR